MHEALDRHASASRHVADRRCPRLRPTDARAALITLACRCGAGRCRRRSRSSTRSSSSPARTPGSPSTCRLVALAAWYRGLLGGVLATVLGALFDTLVFLPPLASSLVDLRDQQLRAGRLPGRRRGGLVHRPIGCATSATAPGAVGRAPPRARRTRPRRARSWRGSWMPSVARTSCATRSTASSATNCARRSQRSTAARSCLPAATGASTSTARQELLEDLEAEADRLYRLVEDLLVLSQVRARHGRTRRPSRCCCRASWRAWCAASTRAGRALASRSRHRGRLAGARRGDLCRAGAAQPA